MPIEKAPPPPPRIERPSRTAHAKTRRSSTCASSSSARPAHREDRARARAFIEGKIEMVRRDPHLTDDEKAAAIAELEGKR